MKKLIISGFLAASLLIVPFAHAQTVDPQEQYQALLRQVIALLTQQVQDLQAKLLTLQDASSTIQSITMPSDVSTSTPITINILPAPVQAPVVSQPVLGAAPVVVSPVSAHLIVMSSGMVVNQTTSSIEYSLSSGTVPTSFTLTLFGPIPHMTDGNLDNYYNGPDPMLNLPTIGTFDIPATGYGNQYELWLNNASTGLISGKTYAFKISLKTATQYDQGNNDNLAIFFIPSK